MIRRIGGVLAARDPESAPEESRQLQQAGFAVLPEVLAPDEVMSLKTSILDVFERYPPDHRAPKPAEDEAHFRYELLNRSEAARACIANQRVLSVIEPLLGEDCHIIANTAWNNPPAPGSEGQAWHVDGGPHIPLPKGVRWPTELPRPVFAIGVHYLLMDVSLEDGPTWVIPGSHFSGRVPPYKRPFDMELSDNGEAPVPLTAKAGDALLFVSDVWHRRGPSGDSDQGRLFLQAHYARRDIAQRLHTTAHAHQLSDETVAWADEDRKRALVGLHPPMFYDG